MWDVRCSLSLLLAIALFIVLPSHAADPLTINGITEPFLDVTLSVSVAGIISTEYFKEGEPVKKGDVILELDKKLEELEVQRRQAVMDQNKMEADSTRVLVQTTKSVSKEESAKKEAEFAIATAEHGIAVQELARRQIVAPFSGSIAEIHLQTGSAVAPYQALARLVDTSRCYFTGHLEGKATAGLRPDQAVKIEIEGGASVIGKIYFISPVVDPASGLAKVKAIFENADGKIRPGVAAKMTAEPAGQKL
jgi:RND family efflux transporter MFP subunit